MLQRVSVSMVTHQSFQGATASSIKAVSVCDTVTVVIVGEPLKCFQTTKSEGAT